MTRYLSIVAVLATIALHNHSATAANEKVGMEASQQTKVQEIIKSPASFQNKSVTLQGEIQNVLGPHAFILDGEGVLNDEIVVLRKASESNVGTTNGQTTTDTAGQPAMKEGEKVEVAGSVRRMSLVDIRREYSMDLDPQVEIEFQGTFPVIVADHIRFISEK